MSFDINAKIRGDSTDLKQKLKDVETEVKQTGDRINGHFRSSFGNALGSLGNMIGKGLTGIGMGAAGAAAVAIAKKFADEFHDKAKNVRLGTMRTGLDADTYQRVDNLTTATDSSPQAFSQAMDEVAEKQQKVAEGGAEANRILQQFAELGVSAADVQKKSYQDLSIQIFRYMKDVELTKEKISALRAIMGEGAGQLLPAMKIGMDSTTAETGMLTDEQLQAAVEFKKAMAETDAIWKDMTTRAGAFFAMLIAAAKLVPEMVGKFFDKDLWKNLTPETPEEKQQREQQADKNKAAMEMIAEKDGARRKAKAEQEAQELQDRNEQKAAEKQLPEVERRLAERTRKLRLASMTPEERQSFFKEEKAEAQFIMNDANEEFEATKDPRAKLRAVQAENRLMTINEEEAASMQQASQAPAPIMRPEVEDRLARIGGGFIAKDQAGQYAKESLDQLKDINNGINQLVRGNGEGDGF